VLVVSGHDEEVFASAVGALQPSGATIVVLMGLGRRVALARQLIDRGWPAATPAAIVADASRLEQQTWRGTIGDLVADGASALEGDGPATIVIGEVAALDLTDVESGVIRTVKEQRNASK
jgi:siroheme synthase